MNTPHSPRHRAPLLVVMSACLSAAVVTACGPEHDDATVATQAAAPLMAQADAAPRTVADRTPPPVPRHLGRVSAVEPITEAKKPSGAGAVIGGVAGGVVGHQFGSGSGQTATTIVGAVGGAVAGNEIEKRRGRDVVGWRVSVDMDNGEHRTVRVSSRDGLAVGDRVRVEGQNLIRL